MAQNLKDLIVAFINQLQDLEYVFQDLNHLTTLDNSVGVQLDGIGELVGLPRFTNDDSVYRDALKFQISVNNSNGTPEDIISFLQQQTGATSINYSEPHPAKILINIIASSTNIPSDLIEQVERIAPAGVEVELTFSSLGKIPFGFGPEGRPNPDVLGFSEANYPATTGGSLSERIT